MVGVKVGETVITYLFGHATACYDHINHTESFSKVVQLTIQLLLCEDPVGIKLISKLNHGYSCYKNYVPTSPVLPLDYCWTFDGELRFKRGRVLTLGVAMRAIASYRKVRVVFSQIHANSRSNARNVQRCIPDGSS